MVEVVYRDPWIPVPGRGSYLPGPVAARDAAWRVVEWVRRRRRRGRVRDTIRDAATEFATHGT
ncbi:hypothetical protein RW1_009_02040 [Rhodococcus wratislaviensis NBRC 100605]|uniref:Uncharacterized protein n=1 Tax=Rhodococcus wratislaviensis NBRC 100605 TaxID=1219028 RepID=X0PMJ0_RHOWR|nr:hypothetical protein RW1_009_02040 [Rhodococcus wratislaviensis NBRC 100605]